MNQPIFGKKRPRHNSPISFPGKVLREPGVSSIGIRGILLVFMFMISSCSGSQNPGSQDKDKQRVTTDDLIEANRNLVNQEQGEIKEYVKEEGLEMEKTGTGLWYKISESGEGDAIQTGDVVELDYTVRLLDGTLCYDSENRGPKSFKVGKGNVESGLQQGILFLKKGAKAKFIMPPHLAHGLVGDDDRIPSRAIIIYDIEVLDVKDSH
ncbi:MAG: FKBP-type peptidyl-prolyl cis-trans isomerase [Bacteroidota bacterium]